ncbi:uncharacterized protein LOC132201722 [Neocloeon triangulifer]|uniref:uncharacterized protein LOC132201722 n=1 Tax=Neocloeon triangulifer TaxID=2078957 RepID=UPI00286F7F90|nr:uncharacterized protein LOC132201722 [Neocloeon triangulifer]
MMERRQNVGFKSHVALFDPNMHNQDPRQSLPPRNSNYRANNFIQYMGDDDGTDIYRQNPQVLYPSLPRDSSHSNVRQRSSSYQKLPSERACVPVMDEEKRPRLNQNFQYGYVYPRQSCVVFENPLADSSVLYQTETPMEIDAAYDRRHYYTPSTSKVTEMNHREFTPRKGRMHSDTPTAAVNAPLKSFENKLKSLAGESRQQLIFKEAEVNEAPEKKEVPKITQNSGPSETVILTANVKCCVEWFSQISKFKKYLVLFEIYAILQRVREHETYFELLLRDRSGPLLQTLFYKMDQQQLPDLSCGQVVRVVGRSMARTRLQAFSVREARQGELQRRDLYLSNQSIKAMKSYEDE